MEILVRLSFDEEDLGPKWMNPDNLNMLLYTETATKKDLLKVVSYNEVDYITCKSCGETIFYHENHCTSCGRSAYRDQ